MDEQVLNKKMAEWAKWESIISDGTFLTGTHKVWSGHRAVIPDFTDSLDACFKWLVPEGNVAVLIVEHHRDGKVFTQATLNKEWVDFVGAKVEGAIKDKAALALCLAIEKLIDGGK